VRNIKLQIQYEGTDYRGWQIQGGRLSTSSPRLKTIQGTIEKALRRILGQRVRLIGSGRTDSGVHAKCQVANFKTDSSIPAEKLRKALNALLPQDIVVSRATEVPPDFHSRFKARSKVYRYHILNGNVPDAFLRKTSFFYPYPLDLGLMSREARGLLGRHDFRSFQAKDVRERGSIRTIHNISLRRRGRLVVFEVEADGFLYNMVRNIVGTLIEIGRGRFPPGSLRRILRSKDRRLAGPTAPARGLCLVRVRYS
jgi:tRNA pseudouridine38-40 synthase